MQVLQEPPLIAVVGPTAVGKTAIGIALAERLNGEIVSADAVAVYRGLDIGAAKPTRAERARVPTHLVDVAAPDEDFTLADFERRANEAIADIRARGRTPIVVGGTGLYVRAVTATLTMPAVAPQPEFRARLWAEVEAAGGVATALHHRLREVDAPSAVKIMPNDAKRIIRALEVQAVTGRAMSSFHTPEGVQGVPRPNTFLFGLRMERLALYARIDRRVAAMIDGGLVEEVRSLRDAGFGGDLKSMQSLGYRHILSFLEGTLPLEEAVSELNRDTRRFAKRQISWFNADPRVHWVDVEAEPMAEAVADSIAAHFEVRDSSIIFHP